jgi:hypothetical protein
MVVPWRKPRPKKATAKKPTATPIPLPRPPTKKAPVKKAPAKKMAVKKAPAKKAPAKKMAVKKVPAQKAPVKEAPAKGELAASVHPLMAPLTTLPDWAQTLMGSGTEIIEFPHTVKCPMVVQISHDGPGRFHFQFRDAWAGDEVFGITGTGAFNGRYSLNFLRQGGFKYLMVDSQGPWILHFEPLSKMRELKAEVGAVLEGVGPEVIQFHAESPMRLDISAALTKDTLLLFGNTRNHRRRLLWETSGFEGTVLTEPHTLALEMLLGKPWSSDTRWKMTVGEISRPQN